MVKQDQTYAKIIAHAWKDARFKEKLLKNPKAALKEMGIDVPANFEVRVIEEKANSMTLVLPKAPMESQELSEKELQNLAGGTFTPFTIIFPTYRGEGAHCEQV